MSSRRLAICAASALAVGGAGAAIAATGDDKGTEVEDAILNDAAGRLDVGADELRTALSEAQLAQIDKAVEDGMLTEEQAEMIKEHMSESGRVLGFPGGPPGPPPFGGSFERSFERGPGGPPIFEAVAEELGISVERLHRQLLSGTSLRKIAEANGKTIPEVKAAAKQAMERDLDKKVEDGTLTEEQAEQIRDELPNILEVLTRGPRVRGDHGFFRDGPPFRGRRGFRGGPEFFGRPGGPPGGPGFGPPPREFWN